ncbi:hypothetical protein ACFXDH_24040, partial [Streptomyces sp. NPDC059467]
PQTPDGLGWCRLVVVLRRRTGWGGGLVVVLGCRVGWKMQMDRQSQGRGELRDQPHTARGRQTTRTPTP